MPIHIVRLGTVCRPPRGVPKAELMQQGQALETEGQGRAWVEAE